MRAVKNKLHKFGIINASFVIRAPHKKVNFANISCSYPLEPQTGLYARN